MQCLVFSVLSVILCYSLVIAVPIHQIPSQTKDAKHQHTSAVAARLLQEIHSNNFHQNDDDFLLDKLWPISPSQTNNDFPQHKDSHLMHWPSIEENSEPELDSFDDILSILEQQWIEDSAEHTNDGEKSSSVTKHVPVMDDHRMKAEDH